MSAGAVRAGKVFVEIGADPKAFFRALSQVNRAIANMGQSLISGGGKMAAFGVGMAAPIVAAVRSGTRFENVLLGIRASTNATAAEIDRIRASSLAMSQALGVGPTEAAQGMLELLKAGMSLDEVLGGAGEAALQFARVGELQVAQAAVVMSDAMNVFGVSGEKAANTLSAAADASSTSIAQMAEAFSMSSAVAGLANQSIDDLSAALAILANAGVKGSDAGTSIKNMLMRLMAPAEDGAAALRDIGLSTDSFRDANGNMRPLVEIIGQLSQAMVGLDQAAKDDLFRRIFGADAIRAASILSAAGVQGFEAMQSAMADALPVGAKFRMLMSGLAGAGSRILASLERLAIVISEALGPALASIAPFVSGAVDGLAKMASENKGAITLFAEVAAAAIGLGTAIWVVGHSLVGVSTVMNMILKGFGLFAALTSPVMLVAAGIGASVFALYKFKDSIFSALEPVAPLVDNAASAIGGGFNQVVADAGVVFGDLYRTAVTTLDGIYEAVAAGDLAGAMDILWAGLKAGWLRGVEALMNYVDPWVSLFQNTFTILGAEIYKTWDALWVSAVTILRYSGAMLLGVFDNIINPLMAAWDFLEGEIRKGWNRIQSLFKEGFDLKAENEKVDTEMEARARQRELSRPGIQGRVRQATQDNMEDGAALDRRTREVDAQTQRTVDEREQRNRDRRRERRRQVEDAEDGIGSAIRGRRERRVMDDQFAQLLKDIESANSIEQIQDLYGQFQALSDSGRLTSAQSDLVEDALFEAQNRIQTRGMNASPSQAAAQAGAEAAGRQSQTSQGNVVGTFSSLNLGSQFGGTSAAERTARATEETARGVRDLVEQGGPRAAA